MSWSNVLRPATARHDVERMVTDYGTAPSSEAELVELGRNIEAWATTQLTENPSVLGIERDGAERRWVLRLQGEEKATFAVWFTLGQRALAYETYLLPAPEENHGAFYEHLLRRNLKLRAVTFAIGVEDAVFLVGQLANAQVNEVELDRILGTLYEAVERCFRPALHIGFASRFS